MKSESDGTVKNGATFSASVFLFRARTRRKHSKTDNIPQTEDTALTEPVISTPECTEYTLTSGDAQITICAEKSSLRLCSLQLSNGTEFLPAVSDFPLPARVIDGDTETSLNWIFSRSEPISNTNSRSAHFYFVSESKGFSLDLVCRAYSTPGPFVFEAFVTNTASYLQRLAPGDLAALNLECPGFTADVWRMS